jgi:hypothetical protein
MALRTNKKTLVAAGASLALAATIAGTGLIAPSTAVWAAPSGPTAPSIEHLMQAQQPQPAPDPARPGPGMRRPGGPDMQQRQQMQQAYQSALAGRLGLTVDQLTAAMKQARIDVINQAVAAGKLPQDQANRMIQAIQSGQRPGQPGMRQGGPQQGMRAGAPGGELASILGMTPQDLQAQFQAGKSLAEIAQAKGISRDDLKKKLLDARSARLDAAVKAGRLTQAQADQIKAQMAANIDRRLDMKPGQQRPQRPAGGGA